MNFLKLIMMILELPWDQASKSCPEYTAWRIGKFKCLTPWKKLDDTDLLFIQKVLKHSPSDRFSLNDIKQNLWFSTGLDLGKYSDFFRRKCMNNSRKSMTKNLISHCYFESHWRIQSLHQGRIWENILLQSKLSETSWKGDLKLELTARDLKV